jgi:hypothetical protein
MPLGGDIAAGRGGDYSRASSGSVFDPATGGSTPRTTGEALQPAPKLPEGVTEAPGSRVVRSSITSVTPEAPLKREGWPRTLARRAVPVPPGAAEWLVWAEESSDSEGVTSGAGAPTKPSTGLFPALA